MQQRRRLQLVHCMLQTGSSVAVPSSSSGMNFFCRPRLLQLVDGAVSPDPPDVVTIWLSGNTSDSLFKNVVGGFSQVC